MESRKLKIDMILKQIPGYRPPCVMHPLEETEDFATFSNVSAMCSGRHTRTFQRNLIPPLRALVMAAKSLFKP